MFSNRFRGEERADPSTYAWLVAAPLVCLTFFASALPAQAAADPPPDSVVPRASCRPSDNPDTGLQGQIPLEDRASGRAAEGYSCNLDVIGTHEGRVFAGFDSYKSCLYMPEETWTIAAGNIALSTGPGIGEGIQVIDMSDPAKPVRTDRLTSPIAMAPDEALAVNAKRGLMVMNSTEDTRIDVYDLKSDCRHPRLLGTFDMSPARGHAGWFSPDGTIYWMTSIYGANPHITPIDLTDPSSPRIITQFTTTVEASGAHNGWSSDNGKYAYACQTGTPESPDHNRILVLKSPKLDGSAPTTEQSLVSSMRLEGAVCQDVKAVSYDGKPYLIGNSEYTQGRVLYHGPEKCPAQEGNLTNFGVPEIFDISNLKSPRVVRHLMLEVDDPANCEATANDQDLTTDASIPGEVYDTHFCRPDRLHNPTILACARFYSGLEVYDIRDPANPKELAYYRPGTLGETALSHPEWGATPTAVEDSFAPPIINAERGEIWFGSYFSGLRVLKFPKSVYPFKDSLTCENDWFFNQYNPGLCPRSAPSPKECITKRSVRLDVRGVEGKRVRSITVSANGKRAVIQHGATSSVTVPLERYAGKVAKVRAVAKLRGGGKVVDERSYRMCRGLKKGSKGAARVSADVVPADEAVAQEAAETGGLTPTQVRDLPADVRYICILAIHQGTTTP